MKVKLKVEPKRGRGRPKKTTNTSKKSAVTPKIEKQATSPCPAALVVEETTNCCKGNCSSENPEQTFSDKIKSVFKRLFKI